MRILIVEDEPLIAMDLEDIILECSSADCVWSRTAGDGLSRVHEGVDFALLDYDLREGTSLPVAALLATLRIPFCFVSGTLQIPGGFSGVPRLNKPFRAHEIQRAIAAAIGNEPTRKRRSV